MSRLAHRFVFLLGVLAFMAGVPLALDVRPALAREPCPHEQSTGPLGMPHQHHHPQQPQHDHGGAACLCCCVGACMGIPDLARLPAAALILSVSPVFYVETGAELTGRSLRPEPAPPRSIA